MTTSWQRFSVTGTVGSTATQLAFVIFYDPTGTAGANDWMEVTGVQLEVGSVATSFKRSGSGGGTIQGELAACQRYYWRSQAGGQYNTYANGGSFTTTGAYINVPFPVTMRVNPTAIEYANLAVQVGNGAITALSSLTIDQQSNYSGSLYAVTASSWTANQPARLLNNNNTAGYLAFTSEL